MDDQQDPVRRPRRRTDADGRARAGRHFEALTGAPRGVLRWDETHHLQGHAHVGDRDYVVIAPRDEAHEPVLLDKDDWDYVSRSVGTERCELLAACAIRRSNVPCAA